MSSSAATDESTPPDIPTTTFSGIFVGEQLEREVPSREEVVDALLHQRRAVIGAPRRQLLGSQPAQRLDLLVERPLFLAQNRSGEAKAQERHVLRGVMPAIDADQRLGLEAVRGLLEHFAPASGDQRFARIEVPRRLVEHQAAIDALLDKQEPAA